MYVWACVQRAWAGSTPVIVAVDSNWSTSGAACLLSWTHPFVAVTMGAERIPELTCSRRTILHLCVIRLHSPASGQTHHGLFLGPSINIINWLLHPDDLVALIRKVLNWRVVLCCLSPGYRMSQTFDLDSEPLLHTCMHTCRCGSSLSKTHSGCQSLL